MPTQDELITVDFSGGLAQRTDQKYVPPGKLTGLINGAFDKDGSIAKRRGFAAIPRTILGVGSLSSAAWLQSYRGELLTSDGDYLYSAAPGNAGWLRKDRVPEPVAARTSIANRSPTTSSFSGGVPAGNVFDIDSITVNGFAVHCWIQQNATSFELRSTVLDIATGVVILGSVLVDSAATFLPRLAVTGSKVVCLWPDTAGKIYIAQLDATSATTIATGWNYFGTGSSSSPVTLISDAFVVSAPQFDVCSGTNAFYVIYNSNNSASPIHVKKYATPGGSVPSPAAAFSSSALAGFAPQVSVGATMNTDASRLLVVYGNTSGGTTNVGATDFAQDLSAEGTPRNLFSISSSLLVQSLAVVATSTTAARAMLTAYGTPSVYTYFQAYTTTSGVGTWVPGFVARCSLASKPFVASGLVCVLLYTQQFASGGQSLQSSLVLVDVGDPSTFSVVPRPICLIASNLASTPVRVTPTGPPGATLSGGLWITAGCTFRTAAGVRGSDQISLNFTPSRSGGVETSGAFILAAGIPSAYDAVVVTEAAFLHCPERISIAQSHTGSGSIANGTYQYCACFAYTNARGEVMRSAPSPLQPITTTGTNDTVTLTIDTLQISKAQDLILGAPTQQRPVVIEVYRSLAGGTSVQLVGTVINDVTQTQVNFQDLSSDASISANQFLYTTGGTLPNASPPCSTIAIMHRDRVFLSGCDDQKQVWFSRKSNPGEPISWNLSSVLTFSDGGAITGLASMDGRLIVFKRDRIFVLDGDGPNDAGLASDYQEPLRLATDLGCVDQRSIVLTPAGIMFQSSVGIYTLTRQLEVVYSGAPVDDAITANPTITSAILHPWQSQVRFTACANTNPSGGSGLILVYDYIQNQWSTYQVYDSVSANTSVPMIDACNLGSNYCWIAANGSAAQETPNAYLDPGGAWITLTVRSAWIQAAKVQGYQRVKRAAFLGTSFSAHNLQLQFEPDFGVALNSHSWEWGTISSMPLEQMIMHVARQKCSSFRVSASDAPPTISGLTQPFGTGQGASFTGFAFLVGVKKGPNKVGVSQRA
ncbi:MAG: hypothetical protein JOZ73_12000 [Solirubrobacterales bacterium]|nr:hypothetical protein [Solirubrobacterales bacterium]